MLLVARDAGREDRMAIVQHTVQYKFAYQACINHAEIVMAATNGDIFAMESPTRKSVIKIDKDSIYEATTSAGEFHFHPDDCAVTVLFLLSTRG